MANRRMTTILSATSAAAMAAALSVPAVAAAAPVELKPGAECSDGKNFFESTQKWEISWGHQYDYAGVAKYTSADHGGLTHIIPGTLKTPEEELQAIRDHDADKTNRNSHYHWWYVSRDMVTNGATTVLTFKDNVTVVGEVAVGTDGCPAVKWTYTEDSVPGTFPVPSEDDPSPFGSLDFLGSLGS